MNLINRFAESIMTRKYQYFLIFSLFVIILILFVLTHNSTRIITERTVERHQQNIASETAKTVELWLKQHMTIVDAFAVALGKIHVHENPETLRLLKTAIRAGNFSDVYVGLTDGVLIDGSGWVPPLEYDPRVRPWYTKAIDAGEISFTNPYIDLTTMKMVIAITRPLYMDNRFIGVLSSDIVLDVLKKSVMNASIGRSGFSFLIDQHGTILVHPDGDLEMNTKFQDLNPSLYNILNYFEKNPNGSYQYIENDREMILSYQKLSNNSQWYLCTTVQKTEAYSLAKNTAMLFAMEVVFKILGVLGLLTLLAVGGSVFVVIVINRHFKTVVNRQEEMLSGKEADLKGEISRRKEIETRYQTIFNVATNGILLSRDGHFVECNRKAAEMFDLDVETVLGKNMLTLSPSHQHDGRVSRGKLREILLELDSGDQLGFKWMFVRPGGTQFPAEVSLKRLQLDNDVVTLFSIWDISKRENAERQLMQAQKMAAMGEMMSAIAHQWRQPLNALATYVASLLPAFYNGMITKAFLNKVVSESDSQIQFMSATINDFREYFKPSKKKVPFHVEETIESAVKLMKPQFKQRDVTFTINRKTTAGNMQEYVNGFKECGGTSRTLGTGSISDARGNSRRNSEKSSLVFGYKNEFIHVLVNIFSNAMDAMAEKKKFAEMSPEAQRIDVMISCDDKSVRLSIMDTGTGIPSHLMEKIFDPYFTTKGTATGTGIGLYMTKMIVEKEMKGTVDAKNIWPEGACFIIRLPLWEQEG